MLEKDATTVWELWDAIDDSGVAHESLNHYSKGAVIVHNGQEVGETRFFHLCWKMGLPLPIPPSHRSLSPNTV